jgi:hypothetical protein
MADGDGICAGDVPPLVGERLTGSGLTLAEAAAALERDEAVALTDIQRRMVEAWALGDQRGSAAERS